MVSAGPWTLHPLQQEGSGGHSAGGLVDARVGAMWKFVGIGSTFSIF